MESEILYSGELKRPTGIISSFSSLGGLFSGAQQQAHTIYYEIKDVSVSNSSLVTSSDKHMSLVTTHGVELVIYHQSRSLFSKVRNYFAQSFNCGL